MGQRQKLRNRLESSHQGVLAFIDECAESGLVCSQVEGEWTLKDGLAHLVSAEQGHFRVIQHLLEDKSTLIPDFDLDKFNDREVKCLRDQSWQDLMANYIAGRIATFDLLDQVSDRDWDKAGPHPGGFETTVAGAFRVIAIHEKRHIRTWQAALV